MQSWEALSSLSQHLSVTERNITTPGREGSLKRHSVTLSKKNFHRNPLLEDRWGKLW